MEKFTKLICEGNLRNNWGKLISSFKKWLNKSKRFLLKSCEWLNEIRLSEKKIVKPVDQQITLTLKGLVYT